MAVNVNNGTSLGSIVVLPLKGEKGDGVKQMQTELATLEARVDQLVAPSGEAPNPAEILDARVGADGSTYDNLGNAIRGQVRDIENSLFHREFNVLDFIGKTGRTHNGVTFTWNDDGTCTIVGTATDGTAFCNIFSNATAFPPFLGAGSQLCAKMKSDANESGVELQVFRYEGGTLGTRWLTLTSDYDGDGVYNNTIPTGFSGLLIRLAVTTGTTVNETVRVSFIPPNAMLYNPNIGGAYVTDANEAKRNGIYFVSTGAYGITNFPEETPGWLWVACIGDKTKTGVLQIYYPWTSATRDPYWRTCQSGVWNDWKKLGSGDDGGTTIENTYNITTSPHITTDANGWLQPVDTDTSSETGKTDMTGAIMSMLTDTGYCHLAKGIYYVSGNIDMPYGSTLEGCGEDTIIRLLSSVGTGYCVKPTRFSTIKGIRFSGGYSDFEPSSPTIGDRNAINFTANADGTGSSMPSIEQCVIDNCWFENFNGSGIYCYNTGGSVDKSLIVTNSYIRRCTAGINISYYSEYQKYTNIVVTRCYYACINNGGNNVFTACTFHGTIGFMLESSRNNAHGSCVGCSFNHIDSWNRPSTHGGGTAILAKQITAGFIFTGCQIWYGSLDIRGSRGIALSDCLIGGNSPEISVTGIYPVFFANCIFHAIPTLNVNSVTKFDNCYLDEDGSIISN